MPHDPSRTLGELLGDHLRAMGLPPDSGVSLRRVTVRFLGLPITFPNFDARRAILVHHDVHHLLTGYDTTWTGEAEIGAFEIATSCRHFWAAWFFNFGGFLFGLGIAPRRTFRAFVRGRHGANLYGEPVAQVLGLRLGDARRALGLDRTPSATFGDVLAFAAWSLVVVVVLVLLPAAVVAWLCWQLR